MPDDRFTPARNFAWLEPEFSAYDRARVVVIPVPYDSTASGWVGSREGPWAIIEASGNMELYDIGIDMEPYRLGIHTLPELAVHTGDAAAMIDRIESVAGEQIDAGKFVVTLGGEHTVAVGSARAHAKRYDGLSVLAFDANADFRDEYLDSPYNHACTLKRISEIAPVSAGRPAQRRARGSATRSASKACRSTAGGVSRARPAGAGGQAQSRTCT